MSKLTTDKIICNCCGHEFEADVFSSVNADLDPELRKKYLSLYNDIYIFECPNCKKRTYMAYPILYHDMTHKFMVQSGYLAYIYRELYNVLHYESNDESIKMMKEMQKDYIYAGATSPIEAKEKVVALENDLDPRLVAIYRYYEKRNYNDYAKENGKKLCREAHLNYDEEGKLAFILDVYDEETGDGAYLYDYFSMERYEEFEDGLGHFIVQASGFLFNDYSVVNFMNWCKQGCKKEDAVPQSFAVIMDEDNDNYYALVSPNDDFENEEIVDVHLENGVKEGQVVAICDYSKMEAPFDFDKACEISITKKA